jgi:type II secretory pathway pseudopilin PulG
MTILRRAITLVEILFGLVLFVLIIGFVFTVLTSSTRQGERAMDVASAVQSFAVVRERLARDLDRALSAGPDALDPTGRGLAMALWVPGEERLERASVSFSPAASRLTREARGPKEETPVALGGLTIGVTPGRATTAPSHLVWLSAHSKASALSPAGEGAGRAVVMVTAFALRAEAWAAHGERTIGAADPLASSPPAGVTSAPGGRAAPLQPPPPSAAVEPIVRLDDGDREPDGAEDLPASFFGARAGGGGGGRGAPPAQLRPQLAHVRARLLALESAARDVVPLFQPGTARALRAPILEYLRAQGVFEAAAVGRLIGAETPAPVLEPLKRAIDETRELERCLSARQTVRGTDRR